MESIDLEYKRTKATVAVIVVIGLIVVTFFGG